MNPFKIVIPQNKTDLDTNLMQKSDRKNIENCPNYHQKTIFRAAILDFGQHFEFSNSDQI
jgi:hypothetical protein